jgi:DNA-binding NtrC family response regulator
LDQIAKKYIQEAGSASGGNMKKMASLLGVSYRSLRYLIEKYQLKSFKKSEHREESGEDKSYSFR